MYDVLVVVVSTTSAFVVKLRTATEYDVAPLDVLQLSVTLALLNTGPGLPVEPGLGFSGVGGTAARML